MSRAIAVLIFAVLLAAAGCARETDPQVVVYVAVDRGQAEPILKQYEQRSGIQVQAVYDAESAKTTGLVSRLLAEAGRPRCDVFWNNELVQTLHLARRGVLAEFRPRAAADLPASSRDPEGRWTGIATRARVIVYNTRHVKAEEAPRSLWDLTLPQWKGKLAIANPQFGTTRTHVAALFAVLGPEKAQELLRGLLANDVRIVDGNAMVKNLVARAQPHASPIYVGLTDADDVLAGQQDGEPVAFVYPDQETIGTLIVPATVCLIRGAPHGPASKSLVEYLVSPEVAQMLAGEDSGFQDVRRSGQSPIKGFQLAPAELLEQLEPSSRWTQEHFHP